MRAVQNVFRRGAVYWWCRQLIQKCGESGRAPVAISLQTREPLVAGIRDDRERFYVFDQVHLDEVDRLEVTHRLPGKYGCGRQQLLFSLFDRVMTQACALQERISLVRI